MSHLTKQQISKQLRELATPERAAVSRRFFKTAPGQYGYGDVFIGLTVPQIRVLAKQYHDCSLIVVQQLLHSKIHEERLLALIILVTQYKKADAIRQQDIFDFYSTNTKYINNWDLVDTSAEYIVGAYLQNRSKKLLYQFARSKNVWERRISIISTFHYIKQRDATETLKIAKLLLHDKHDLIHKAVGWMLREVGKRCFIKTEEQFLDKYYQEMPRTMVRYAIERFPKNKQKRYNKDKLN